MNRSYQFTSVALTSLFALITVGSQSAHAQVTKPFKIAGSGVAPIGLSYPVAIGGSGLPVPHFIEGNATFLGRHTGLGSELTLTAVPHPDGSFSGTFESGPNDISNPYPPGFTFIAANGDYLVCTYGDPDNGACTQGTFTLTPVSTPGLGQLYIAKFVAHFVPVSAQCTGRFAGVTGGWVMYAATEPFRLGIPEPLFYSWRGEGSLTFNR